MLIVDCFPFYNEVDILLYRMTILDPVVDYFVICESTRTFAGYDKPLTYLDNSAKFKKFRHKIIHVIQRDFDPAPADAWKNENAQRNFLENGIATLNDKLTNDDLILISDVDEIPNPAVLAALKKEELRLPPSNIAGLEMDFYYFNLETRSAGHERIWVKAKIMTYGHYCYVLSRKPQLCRFANTENISQGGWHLSYFMSPRLIANKIRNFAHQEFNNEHMTDEDRIAACISQKTDLFERGYERWEHVPLTENTFLPPKCKTLLVSYLRAQDTTA